MKEKILKQLSTILDPDLGKDIVTLGFIKELEIHGDKTKFILELTTPACPVKDELKKQCEQAALKVDGINDVEVILKAQEKKSAATQSAENLKGITSIVAISSCKGGVGKSTVSVNIATALAQQGASVGLLDADIFGPSLPTMFGLSGQNPQVHEQKFIPFEVCGLKMMSAGFLFPADEAAVLRGPMVSNVLQQILFNTEWGELDYLFIDMPPGTGDVQLTLSQAVPLCGAAIVTTPQKISLIDVVKGIEMFSKVNVPILGVIENMSYLAHNDQKIPLYGPSGTPTLANMYGLNILGNMPFYPEIVTNCDKGTPASADPSSEPGSFYKQISLELVREISKAQHNDAQIPNVDIDW
jgi:ATP-binding protein involved in chromosome partitioning